jgi:conserved oligomeric Golgi complex subunit 4
MTRLFEVVAGMIDQQEDMVESYYGPGSMHIVILRLQREVDIQSSMLLNEFKETRQIERKVTRFDAD